MKKRVLSIKEAAEYVGISPNVIRDLIGKQRFPFKDVSRGEKAVYRFDIKDLDTWIETLPGLTPDQLKD
jgi:excisionase family DNA binding protein